MGGSLAPTASEGEEGSLVTAVPTASEGSLDSDGTSDGLEIASSSALTASSTRSCEASGAAIAASAFS